MRIQRGGRRGYAKATEVWAYSFDSCWRCRKRGAWKYGLTIHHIVRGAYRQANNLATTAIICGKCHTDQHNSHGFGVTEWLAVKRWYDKANYSLPRFLRAWAKADGFITEADVDAAETKLIERCILPQEPWREA